MQKMCFSVSKNVTFFFKLGIFTMVVTSRKYIFVAANVDDDIAVVYLLKIDYFVLLHIF